MLYNFVGKHISSDNNVLRSSIIDEVIIIIIVVVTVVEYHHSVHMARQNTASSICTIAYREVSPAWLTLNTWIFAVIWLCSHFMVVVVLVIFSPKSGAFIVKCNQKRECISFVFYCFENLLIAITLEPTVQFWWGFQQNVPLLMRTSIK